MPETANVVVLFAGLFEVTVTVKALVGGKFCVSNSSSNTNTICLPSADVLLLSNVGARVSTTVKSALTWCVLAPPSPVFPPSSVSMVNVSLPVKPVFGV